MFENILDEIDDSKTYEVPDRWTWTTLGTCVDVLDSQRVPVNADERTKRIEGKKPDELIPYYGATGPVGWIDDYLFDEELLLLGEDGAPFLDMSRSITYIIRGKSWINNHAHVLRALNGMTSNSYLGHYLNTFDFQGYVTGTTRLKLNQRMMNAIPVPLAPLNEQRRIVEAIEALFSRLDAGIAALKRAQANLKRYKASVLKAACEGQLVPQDPDDEPASELLARILAERRAKWEAEELANYEAKGKKPPKNWRYKYPEPQPPDTSDLPELPEGWVWATAEQLCSFITKGTTPEADKLYPDKGEIPFIKVYNLTNQGILDFGYRPTFIDFETHSGFLARSKVYPGDVLMNIVGPPLGKVSIVPDIFPEWNMNQAVARFRTMPSFNNHYLSLCLLNSDILSWATSRAKATAGQFNLTLQICRELPIPVPPYNEQENIVREVESILSIVDAMEETIQTNLIRAERLRQSILKDAFAGRLVPQDPDDEPAGILLERIRAEREQRR